MLSQSLKTLLLLPAALRVAVAAPTNTTSAACNNSPSLCDRAYNNITYLGAHDSPFVRDAANDYDISGNQYYNSTVQLSAGVRLLTAQVQTNTTTNALHVCHTSCDLYDAGTLSSWLSEVNQCKSKCRSIDRLSKQGVAIALVSHVFFSTMCGVYVVLVHNTAACRPCLMPGELADPVMNIGLVANPSEVVTVLLVNGADASASDLATEYQQAGISAIAYTPTSSSSSSSSYDWPTLRSLINNGTRLLNLSLIHI